MAKNNQKKEKAARNREHAKKFKKKLATTRHGRRPGPGPSSTSSPTL